MMVYSLINVPYASLMGVMSADGKERTSLATFRFVLAFAGGILVLALAKPLADIFSNMSGNGVNLKFGWQMATIVFALVSIVLFWITFLWTRERIRPVSEKTSLKLDLKDLWGNRPWFILLGAGIAVIFFNSIRDGAAMYYFKYYIPNQEAFQMNLFGHTFDTLSSVYFVVGQAASIAGVVLAIPVSNRFGKKGTFLSAMLMASVFSVYFYFIDRNSTSQIFAIQFLISLCAGITFPLIWSMYADAADYSEWKNKRRATGLIFSASSMSQKIGWTIGGALVGWLLGYYGFQANAEQTETAQNGIRMMLSFYPAIGTLLGVGFMMIYPLNEKMMQKISIELAAWRDK
jgi:GPH family glycoside/pentoside/hexuronide:cation symporter